MMKWQAQNLQGPTAELKCQRRHSINIIDIGRPRALWHSIKIGAFEKTGISHLKCGMPEITGLRGPRHGGIHNIPKESARSTGWVPVSYTHLRAHETDSYLVC